MARKSQIERKLLDQQIWELRALGNSPQAISDQLALPITKVRQSLSRVADEYQIESAAEIIKLELDRLDILLKRGMEILADRYTAYNHGKMMTDENQNPVADPLPTLKAIEAILKIMDRRSKYLGLDAPSRSEHHMSITNQPTEADLQVLEIINQFKQKAQALTPEQLKQLPQAPSDYNPNLHEEELQRIIDGEFADGTEPQPQPQPQPQPTTTTP